MQHVQVKKPALSKQTSQPKTATAPSPTDTDTAAAESPTDADVALPGSIPRDVTARGLHSECVVCQDAEVTALSCPQLSKFVAALTLSTITSRSTISSRPSNPHSAFLFHLRFSFGWQLCTFIRYIYLLISVYVLTIRITLPLYLQRLSSDVPMGIVMWPW